MNTKKIISLFVIVCMLSPSAFTYLPSGFLPGVSAATSSSQAQISTQPSSIPLSPGSVKYQNTWNNSQALVCSSALAPSAPLVPVGINSWNLSLKIPATLFMNDPLGQYVTQNYQLFSNGTFTVSDSAGNTFGIRALSGLPSGSTKTIFVANNTEAIQNSVVTVSGKTVANVSVSYSVKQQFCQPSGIEMTIGGDIIWGTSTSGRIGLSFTKAPIKINNTRAWFGNESGVLLGFDWSDSIAMHPEWNNSSQSLNYKVGSTFAIDPVTITTVNYPGIGYLSAPRAVVNAGGIYVAFYSVSSGQLNYAYSSNATSWTTSSVSSSCIPNGADLYDFTAVVYGNTVYYACPSDGYSKIYYNSGTVSSSGVTWGSEQ
ncbi:MAG: hypothetical protein ABSE82_13610, partial [Nitrososphaerales archaeon]